MLVFEYHARLPHYLTALGKTKVIEGTSLSREIDVRVFVLRIVREQDV